MIEKNWVVLSEKGKDLKETLVKNRNIEDQDSFFKPHLYKLTSARDFFSDIEIAIERIKKAIKNQELIYIYGDFDVDGITGTAILWETINFLGGKVMPYIPHRETEGYGLHEEAIEKLASEGAKVIISVDCGITAVHEAIVAKKLGVDLIITDHHTKQEEIPSPFALLHTTKLAGSGVAFILAKELLEAFNKGEDEQFFRNLELAAVGTIADMVPLTGDNRIITSNGLLNLSHSARPGFKALYEEAGISKKISPHDVGFIITPRLNAAGRMEHAMDSLRLLVTKKADRAAELAKKLSITNRQRQEAMASALEHARENLKKLSSKMIVVHHPSYQQGVIGLVAGRLVDEFYRPSVVISEINPLSKGSARSISGFNITEAIGGLKNYLLSHGGHPMAAGFSLNFDNILKFKEEIINQAEKNLRKSDLNRILKIETELPSEDLTQKTLDTVQSFEPFGVGNSDPVFITKNLEVADARNVGKEGKHLKMTLRDEKNHIFNAIGFGFGGNGIKIGQKYDAAFTLSEDTWNGNKKIQLKIKDLKIPS